jgi:hypothetical protein
MLSAFIDIHKHMKVYEFYMFFIFINYETKIIFSKLLTSRVRFGQIHIFQNILQMLNLQKIVGKKV